LYAAGFFAAIFESFQWPAYSSAVTVMLPKEQYTRASGLMGLAESIPGILAPALAGFLIVTIGIEGILLIDIITFCFAVGLLFLVFIPRIEATSEGTESRSGGLVKEVSYGFRYIFKRPSLLGLQMVFFGANLTGTFGMILLAPMILSRTNNNEIIYGTLQAVMGFGGVIGGVWLSAWGGPKRRVYGVLLGMTGSSLFGQILLGIGQDMTLWLIGSFFFFFFLPLLNWSNQAIWQAKVAPDIQGRVFSVRRLIAQITAPIAMLMAGPLADQIFEPAMMPGGALADTFGWLVGIGAGAGIGLIFVITGFLGVAVCIVAYFVPFIRHAEDILPDHQIAPIADELLFET
jgi:MFS transporter, DHA3 family, macrolide efflux protein